MFSRLARFALAVSLAAQAQDGLSSRTSNQSDNDAPEQTSVQTTAPPPVVCPAGGPIGAVDLRVRSPQRGVEPLPFRTINHLTEGDTVLYSPVLRGHEKRPGEVSLVLVPAKRQSGKDFLIVSDPRPADKPQEWKVDRTVSIAAFVYGPEGLSKKKVRGFLSQDELLIAQLADYAEKTSETEALLQALSSADSSSAGMNAALTGFASQYGLSVAIDKTSPPGVQAQTLFATMNPQLATYDPITPSSSSRIGQTASLTTAAASLFFGSPIGLAAGGTAMLLDLRAIAFPGTQFRSSFAQPLKEGINLCGQRTPAPPHTRVAYLWANRIPNIPAPVIQIEKANYIPPDQKTPVPVDVPPTAWKYLDRSRQWTLENPQGQKTPVNVLKLANQKAIEIDLTKVSISPGDYHLAGFWDWTHFAGKGDIHVVPLSTFNEARLQPASQDKLLEKGGKTAVTLEHSDFEFTTKVEVKKVGDEFATAEAVPFLLPVGLRLGPQNRMDVQINTGDLDPGEYQLLVSQQDNKSHAIPMQVLPNPPKIANLPIVANQGASVQHYVLKGERLGLVTKLVTPAGELQLDPGTTDQNQRNLTVQLKTNLKLGTKYSVTAQVKDRSEPLSFPDALQITGPLPLIASSKLSVPAGAVVAMNPGEVAAGSILSAMLDVKNAEPQSSLRIGCSGGVGPQSVLRIGEQTDKWSLQQLSPDQLFVSYDTSALPAGCSVQAVLDNGPDGKSEAYPLAHILRLPQVDQFTPVKDQPSEGKHAYTLVGRNLEMIEQVGWDQLAGFPVTELPTPIAGEGQKQSLRVVLPDQPTPTAAVYFWLRGEKSGRATTITNTIPAIETTPKTAVSPPQPAKTAVPEPQSASTINQP